VLAWLERTFLVLYHVPLENSERHGLNHEMNLSKIHMLSFLTIRWLVAT
jgi:hypothetical protein